MKYTVFQNIETVLRSLVRGFGCAVVVAVVVTSSFVSTARAQGIAIGALPRPRIARNDAAPPPAAPRADSSTSCRERALTGAAVGAIAGALGGALAGVVAGGLRALAAGAAQDSRIKIHTGRDAAIGAGIGGVALGASLAYAFWHDCKVRR